MISTFLLAMLAMSLCIHISMASFGTPDIIREPLYVSRSEVVFGRDNPEHQIHVDHNNSLLTLFITIVSQSCLTTLTFFAYFIYFNEKMETTNVEKGMLVFLDVRMT